MKSLILLSFLASSLVLAESKTIAVKGMTCGSCVKNVEKAVCEGLKYSKENCQVKIGEVTVIGDKVDSSAIEAAIVKAGYEVVAPATASTAADTTPAAQPTATPKKKK